MSRRSGPGRRNPARPPAHRRAAAAVQVRRAACRGEFAAARGRTPIHRRPAAERCGTTSNAITIASTLRAYLRYRASCGDAVQPLLAVIASPAHWSMASLPRAPEARRSRAAVELVHRCAAVAQARLCRRPPGARPGAARHRDQPAATGRHRLAPGHRHAQAHEVSSPGRAAACRWSPARPWRPTCDTNDRKTSDTAVFVRRLAPHDEPIGVDAIRRIVPRCLPTCRHPAWPRPCAAPHAGLSDRQPAAARSRRWLTCCGTGH